jgi:hypothetical protein
MLEVVNKPWTAIIWRGCIAAAVAATTLGGATAANAHDHWGWHRHHYFSPYYVATPRMGYYYAPPPVYYARPPVAYYPEPMAYAPAYPAYGPPSSLNFGVTLPLR